MEVFDILQSTIYAPMLGRIYASEHYPHIFYDEKAIALKSLIPPHPAGEKTQNQLTLLGTAIRNAGCDRYVKEFLKRHKDGIVVNLGCGLDTAFFRCDNGRTNFYEVDLPEVINYRKFVIEDTDRDHLIACDAFKPQWIQEVRKNHPNEAIMIIASGFFQYFTREDFKNFMKMLSYYGKIELVFETFSTVGMKGMLRYINLMGAKTENIDLFHSNDNKELAEYVHADFIGEELFFSKVNKKGIKLITKYKMKLYDRKGYIKFVHLGLK